MLEQGDIGRSMSSMTNLEKFKEWIANATVEQIAEYLLQEYDGIVYTSDRESFDDSEKDIALKHEIDWLKEQSDSEYWEKW